MSETSRHDFWQAGANYDAYMGRWSRLIADRFLDWMAVSPGRDWIDIGCGTGSLSAAVLSRATPKDVIGIDASEDFVRHAAAVNTDPRASFRQGDAQALDIDDASRDAVVSGLVLNFVPNKVAMLSEMARIARPGGSMGFFVWDYPSGGVEFIREFWDAACTLDPTAADLSEGRRFPDCTETALTECAASAGWAEVTARALEIPTRFRDFADFWAPFTLGAGPAPGYCTSLSPDKREALRNRLSADLARDADGTIALTARAWAVKGVPPA